MCDDAASFVSDSSFGMEDDDEVDSVQGPWGPGTMRDPGSQKPQYMECGQGFGDGALAEPMALTTIKEHIEQKERDIRMTLRPPTRDDDDGAMCTDDGASSRASSRGKRKPVPYKRQLCWLCSFCTHNKAKQMALFISDQISEMSPLHIAEQVKDEILSEYPHARGAQKRDIIRHIQFHMLDPNVRMATMLRSLMSLAETVRLTMQQRDADTGELELDVKQADFYLRVLNQVQNTYRAGNGRLLFSAAGNLAITNGDKD